MKHMILWVGWVALMTAAGPTWAQSTSRIGIFPFQSVESSLPDRELRDLTRKVLRQFDQNDLYKVVQKYPLMGGKAPSKKNPELATRKREVRILNKFLGNAVKQMGANSFGAVIPLLKLGLSKAAAASRWPETFPILARMCGLWALASFRMGSVEEGELLLKVLARMNPNPLPPEVTANRQMKYRYQRALRSIQRRPKGSIKVIGTEGATIYVDGKKAGAIPHEISSLPRGIHYVRVYKEGHFSWGKALKVTPGQATTASAYLRALPTPKQTPADKARFEIKSHVQLLDLQSIRLRMAAQRLCRMTQIDHLLTAHLKKQGEKYALTPIRVKCSDGNITYSPALMLDSSFIDAEMGIYRALIALIRNKGRQQTKRLAVVRRPPPGGGVTPKPGKALPVHQQWWFWTLITLGVAGGAAAATTVVILNQPPRIGVAAKWTLK